MMNSLRYWFIAICIWFFFLYNIEKLGGVINLDTFVYIMAVLCAVLVILIQYLHTKPLYWTFFASLVPYLTLKLTIGSPIGGTQIPITITEICAIGLSIMFSGKLAKGLEDVQSSIKSLTLGQLKQDTQSFKVGQGQLYREVRRARQYKRPITLLSIAPTDTSKQRSLHRFIEDAQRAILEEYINARVVNLLVNELKDYDVITQRDDHFITLLPETDGPQAREVIKKLEDAAREELGLDLKVGYSTFPDEAVTFERLLEQAEAKMGSRQAQLAELNLPFTATSINGVATQQ